MFGYNYNLPFMPCEECGASVKREERGEHECNPERKLDYEIFQMQQNGELGDLEEEVAAFFSSPQGRFECYCVERDRTGREPPTNE